MWKIVEICDRPHSTERQTTRKIKHAGIHGPSGGKSLEFAWLLGCENNSHTYGSEKFYLRRYNLISEREREKERDEQRVLTKPAATGPYGCYSFGVPRNDMEVMGKMLLLLYPPPIPSLFSRSDAAAHDDILIPMLRLSCQLAGSHWDDRVWHNASRRLITPAPHDDFVEKQDVKTPPGVERDLSRSSN